MTEIEALDVLELKRQKLAKQEKLTPVESRCLKALQDFADWLAEEKKRKVL